MDEVRQDDCYAELISAVINQAVLDALAPPRKSNSTKKKANYCQEVIEKIERTGIEFIESDYLDVFFKAIKMLGRASSNAKVIRRLVRKYRAEGTYVVIQSMVTNETDWRELNAKIFSKRKSSKKDRSDEKVPGNSHGEER